MNPWSWLPPRLWICPRCANTILTREANLLAPLADVDTAARRVHAYRRRRKTGGRDFAPTPAIATPATPSKAPGD